MSLPPLLVGLVLLVSLKMSDCGCETCGRNLVSTLTLALSMNEPRIGRGPNTDTCMMVVSFISKYADPLEFAIRPCLRKNCGTSWFDEEEDDDDDEGAVFDGVMSLNEGMFGTNVFTGPVILRLSLIL